MRHCPAVFVLRVDEEAGCPEWIASGAGWNDANLRMLARALSVSPLWAGMGDAVLVVRSAPRPVLGILGYLDEAAEARVEALRWQLSTLPSLRYVSYQQAEKDCERLAGCLIERFGRDALHRFRFVGVPRGGLLVLGMLAYALDVRQAQIEPPHPPELPLVVVDDCALTGARFGHFLRHCDSSSVIFAHLYSHPDLRAAIEAREPRVLACLSARDLRDHAPARLSDEYSAWRERWRTRTDDYWTGQPDHVCFAWSEPDIAIWNPVVEEVECGWRLMPPELCLKNRPAPGAKPLRVQVQPEGKGQLKPSAHALFGTLQDQIVIANIETKSSFSLAGAAADMWRAILEHGNLEEAAVALLRSYDVHETALKADLRAFVEDLLARGMLEQK